MSDKEVEFEDRSEVDLYQGSYVMNQYFSAEYIRDITSELKRIALASGLNSLFLILLKAQIEAEYVCVPLTELNGDASLPLVEHGPELRCAARGEKSGERRVKPSALSGRRNAA